MTEVYLYVCDAHGKKYGILRPMQPIEHLKGSNPEEVALILKLHLDSCQIKGCQFGRTCVTKVYLQDVLDAPISLTGYFKE